MWSTTRTRYLLELQGYRGLCDRNLVELDPWLRVVPSFYAGWALVASLQGAAGAIALLAVIAFVGAVAPLHPFDLPYNLVIRHWTGTPPIPASGPPRRFACAVASMWLTGTAVTLATGAAALGLALGLAFAATALVPVVTGLCVPSWVLTRLRQFRSSHASQPGLSSDALDLIGRHGRR
jgi:hypothetical protein